jgi:hypothetical protein
MNRLLEKSPIAWRRAAKYHHACGDNKEFFPENAALPIFCRNPPPQPSCVQQAEERAILYYACSASAYLLLIKRTTAGVSPC